MPRQFVCQLPEKQDRYHDGDGDDDSDSYNHAADHCSVRSTTSAAAASIVANAATTTTTASTDAAPIVVNAAAITQFRGCASCCGCLHFRSNLHHT